MEIWQLIVLALVGIIAGWLNVMAGGGSLLTVPVMLFMGIPAPVANGTNRIAILAQNLTAVTTFRKRGFSDFRLSLAAAAAVGALAVFASQLELLWWTGAALAVGNSIGGWLGGTHHGQPW